MDNAAVLTADTDVVLVASGDILAGGSAASDTVVNAGHRLDLAAGGSIAAASAPLRIDSSLGAGLVANAPGEIAVTETVGDLTLGQVTSSSDDVVLETLSGDLRVEDLAVQALAGTARLTAAGGILGVPAANGVLEIQASQVDATASSGGIDLEIEAGQLRADASQDIVVRQLNEADLLIESVTSAAGVTIEVRGSGGILSVDRVAATGQVHLISDIAILDARGDDAVNVESLTGILFNGGAIGSPGDPLEIDYQGTSGELVNRFGSFLAGMYVTEVSGDLAFLHAVGGDLVLRAPTGGIRVGEIGVDAASGFTLEAGRGRRGHRRAHPLGQRAGRQPDHGLGLDPAGG